MNVDPPPSPPSPPPAPPVEGTGEEKAGQCPDAAGVVTTCKEFDPSKNCLKDEACPDAKKCCPEGCNKVCKAATFKKAYSLSSFWPW